MKIFAVISGVIVISSASPYLYERMTAAEAAIIKHYDYYLRRGDNNQHQRTLIGTTIYMCEDMSNDSCVDAMLVGLDNIPTLQPPLPRQDKKQIACLAKNIFEEAGTESLYSRLHVAYGTINRVISDRWPNSICGVVYEKGQMSWTEFPNKVNRPFPDRFIDFAEDVLIGKYDAPWCKITNWHNPHLDKKGSYNERKILSGKTECSITIGRHNYIALKE